MALNAASAYPTQYVERGIKRAARSYFCHTISRGLMEAGMAKAPWRVYGRTWETPIKGLWIVELEGEKSNEIAEGAGHVAISQPGHAHSVGLSLIAVRAGGAWLRGDHLQSPTTIEHGERNSPVGLPIEAAGHVAAFREL